METWTLALSYWLHLLATIAWIGGLAGGMFVLRTVLRTSPERDRLSDLFYQRFTPVAMLSLAVLLATGMMQLSGEKAPNYQGTLTFTTPWSQVLLAKHLVIGAMVLVMVYMQAVIDPAMRRQDLLAAAGKGNAAEADALRRRRMQALGATLALGAVVLLLTAVATSL